jgi:hypothetical protein
MNEFGDHLDGAVDVAVVLIVLHNSHSHARFAPSYLCLGLVIRTFDPYIHVCPGQPSRLVGMRGDFQRKGSALFKSQQYRAKATECGELVKSSTGAEESRKFQDLEDRFVSLADNERDLAEAYHNALHIDEQDRTRGAALAAEEERVLRCLGAAIIMQWNDLPKTLQREIFDTAGSVGRLLETATLRGQIARFLHKHKNEAGRGKLPLTEDTPGDARWGAAALSRWDNEGGAVRDGLPM